MSKPRTIVFLIHGGALSGRMYKDVTPLLTNRGYDVVAPDLPGHGENVSLGPFTFERSTKYLKEQIEQSKAGPGSEKKIVAVGVSLGGQAVLDLIKHHTTLVDAALVSGVSIAPPDDKAQWEMPHMPTSQEWLDLISEDVKIIGMEAAQALQAESFRFRYDGIGDLPPTMVMIGEDDTAMAKRDFMELSEKVRRANGASKSTVLHWAWHNHPIDVPNEFYLAICRWVEPILGLQGLPPLDIVNQSSTSVGSTGRESTD